MLSTLTSHPCQHRHWHPHQLSNVIHDITIVTSDMSSSCLSILACLTCTLLGVQAFCDRHGESLPTPFHTPAPNFTSQICTDLFFTYLQRLHQCSSSGLANLKKQWMKKSQNMRVSLNKMVLAQRFSTFC